MVFNQGPKSRRGVGWGPQGPRRHLSLEGLPVKGAQGAESGGQVEAGREEAGRGLTEERKSGWHAGQDAAGARAPPGRPSVHPTRLTASVSLEHPQLSQHALPREPGRWGRPPHCPRSGPGTSRGGKTLHQTTCRCHKGSLVFYWKGKRHLGVNYSQTPLHRGEPPVPSRPHTSQGRGCRSPEQPPADTLFCPSAGVRVLPENTLAKRPR